MAINLQHQTAQEFVARFRERYLKATREDCARLATWLLNRIDAGDLTDAQVRAAFGLTAQQYSALKTRMGSLRAAWLAVRAAAGE